MKKSIQPLLLLSAFLLSATQLQAQTDSITVAGLPSKLFWENTPVKFNQAGNSFAITAGAKTDMFRDPNVTYNTDNAPKLFFIAGDNFVLTAGIQHAFASKWDGGAIVLKTDSLNWIKFCFEKDYTGTHRVVSVVTNNISDDCNSVAIPGNKVYYKIAKADNVITLYFSADGQKWFLIRHLQFNAPGPIKLGFLAQSPTGNSATVTFTNIHYYNKKISDPYTGE